MNRRSLPRKTGSETGQQGSRPSPVFFHIGVNASRATAAYWGDTHYANGLGRALARLTGGGWSILFRGEMPETADPGSVVIRILGPHLEEPVPGMTNLVWMISPPDLAPLPMLVRFQGVLSASGPHAESLSAAGCPTIYQPQVTDAQHFRPDRKGQDVIERPVVFVGGLAARADRRLVFDAVEAGFEPQIWGPGWRGAIPDRLWCGERADHDELARIYANARIILNSHMPQMARMGFMSNRSYDALASGAFVVTDRVAGHAAPDLPELHQIGERESLAGVMAGILEAPPLTISERMALHSRIAAHHSFDQAARAIHAMAQRALEQGLVASPAYRVGRSRGIAPPQLIDPALSGPDVQAAMRSAAERVLELARYLEQRDASPLAPPAPAREQGVIHSLMADMRELQQIATCGDLVAGGARIAAIATGARRVAEVLGAKRAPIDLAADPEIADSLLARVKANRPFWMHSPEGYDRDARKASVALRPRKKPVTLARPVGVFMHLYHDDLAGVLAERLAAIRASVRLYVSTDTAEKADRLRAVLPAAEVRVMENRGRDIFPKLFGFRDAYESHDIVLHLHGKKSLHSSALDEWLTHILDCLLGSEAEINRILSFFDAIPQVGIVMPVAFRKVLGAAHWGDNHDIARELAWRMGLSAPLPSHNDLRFPAGSMFWARTDALRPILDLKLGPDHFPPETGQVDGTLAHAVERMVGVACVAGGYHLLPVSGMRIRQYIRFQTPFSSNADLRRVLTRGRGAGSIVN